MSAIQKYKFYEVCQAIMNNPVFVSSVLQIPVTY